MKAMRKIVPIQRSERDRDLVRRTALLLSANLPLQEVFGQICVLLSAFVDAPIVLICSALNEAVRVEYALIDGVADVPDNPVLPPQSVSAHIIAENKAQIFRTQDEWPSNPVVVTVQGRSVRPQSGLFVPIAFGGQVVGVLSVQSERENAYDENDREALETCALYLGALMHDEAQRREAERYAKLVSTDGLTGVGSRRHLDVVLEKERRRCEREQAPLSIVLFDVDYFKGFNDAYGHVAGDTCLRQIARAAANCIGRPGDSFARYGGEEFIAVLPWTDLPGAIKVAERMRQAVFALAIPHEGSSLQKVSISVGVFSCIPTREADSEYFIQSADSWLYRAKETGRNRVSAEGYVSTAEGADRKTNVPHNVPEPRTTFIGRVEDVQRVRELLERDRLISIVGPGGCGKTRTVIETARALREQYPDGAWFINLASVSDGEALVVAIASTVRAGAGADVGQLAMRLATRNMLLVLDNCEHLVEACADLADRLLDAAPNVRMLITSREPLGVSGERVYRLPMLALEDAVDLFLERAKTGGVKFAGERATIENIVRRLDGMPLAIELAAARLTVMTPQDLLHRLDDCLQLLRPTSRALPSRQQTLHALIDWSYRLLSDEEQRLFRRLAIFPDSWPLDAVAAVCSGSIEAMNALVSKSLVERIDEEHNSRFRFLNVTREYALSLLPQTGEEEQLLEALARYFAQLAVCRAEQLTRMPMRTWLRAQAPERENYQLAVRWALGPRGDLRVAAEVLEALRPWMDVRGAVDYVDILPLLESVLSEEDLPRSLLAAVALSAAYLHGTRLLRRSLECAQRAAQLYAELEDPIGYAYALERLGTAQRYVEGGVNRDLLDEINKAIGVAKAHGEKRLVAGLLRLLSDIYSNDTGGDSLQAEREVIIEACELLRECGDEDRSGTMLGRLAVASFWHGDYEDARNTCRAAITLLEQAQEPWNAAFQMMNLGLYETFREDFTAARVALQKARELLREYGHEYAMANSFAIYATLAQRLGHATKAIRLLGFATSLFDRGPRQQVRLVRLQDQIIAKLRSEVGEEIFALAWGAGTRMSAEQAEHEAEEL